MGRVAIFVEDRLIRDRSGAVHTQNRRLQGEQWRDLGPSDGSVTLCARVKRAAKENEASHEVSGSVADLPYYRGFRNALFKMPSVVLHTSRIVRDSDLVIVKFPGLIGTIGAIVAKLGRKPLAIHLVGGTSKIRLLT